jgi:hypothetical protein
MTSSEICGSWPGFEATGLRPKDTRCQQCVPFSDAFFGDMVRQWDAHQALSRASKRRLAGFTLEIIAVTVVLAGPNLLVLAHNVGHGTSEPDPHYSAVGNSIFGTSGY